MTSPCHLPSRGRVAYRAAFPPGDSSIMHRRIAALLTIVSLSACGSASDNFIGEYDSVSTGTVTSNGETTQGSPTPGTLVIVEGKGAGTVFIQVPDCQIGAVVKSDTTLEMVSKSCPPKTVGDCEVTQDIAEGTGTLSGDKLVIEASGTNSAVCAGGSKTSTFTLKIDATKKK